MEGMGIWIFLTFILFVAGINKAKAETTASATDRSA